MISVKLMLLLLLLGVESHADSVKYNKFKAYRVVPKSKQQLKFLERIRNNFLFELHYAPTVIIVPPFYQNKFETILLKKNISYNTVIKNLAIAIQKEKTAQRKQKLINKGDIAFDRYLRYTEIQNYLGRLAVAHSDLVTIENYGSSYEGRNLTLIKVSTGSTKNKPIVFVDAGIHAREWITPAQALYIVNQLVENSTNINLVDKVDWIVIPLINPDGYEYTYTKDRFWRKTRSKGLICDGVDLNRNFNFHWRGKGADRDECSDAYAGPRPFSESESIALSQVLLRHADRIKLYITFHAPLQSLLYPYGYTSQLPVNNEELLDLGLKVAKSIYAVNKNKYKVGTSVQLFAYTAGSSRDWAYGVAKINLSYTVELPPYPASEYEIPPEKILSVVAEMFEAIKTFHQYVQDKFYSN